MRGSSPRMTYYKTVMAVLDTAIFFRAADARIKSAHDEDEKRRGNIFCLTTFLDVCISSPSAP